VIHQVIVSSRKKVSIKRTPGRGLICIFSKWPPVKPSTYYYVFMVGFTPYKCISNIYMKIGFLNQMNIFSSTYDVLWRKYDVGLYDVIVNSFTGNGGGGNLPQGRFICKILPIFKLNVTVIVLLRCHRITWPSEKSDGIIISTSGFSL